MHHYSQLEALAAARILRRSAGAEDFGLAHRSRAASRAVRTTRGQAGAKNVRLTAPRLSATRMTGDTPNMQRQRRAS
jgi:hypothetical protein